MKIIIWERVPIAILFVAIWIVIQFNSCAIGNARKRIDAMENRLQNVERLFSVFISESRSRAFIGSTNRLPVAADEER